MNDTLLLFQVGPVQDFIAQARSTRDLWSGSFLLSWQIAHALHGLTNNHPAVHVVFPAIASRGNLQQARHPLVQWLRAGGQALAGVTDDEILAPNLPNVLLALVPAAWTRDDVQRFVCDPMRDEWLKEVEECLKYYRSRCPFSADEERLLRLQAARFWQITWQLWPLRQPADTLALFRQLCGDDIPVSTIQSRLPPNATPQHPELWPAHFQLVSHRLNARRQTREFDAWPVTPLATRDKDSLSGREEAVADKVWLARARRHRELRHRFRAGDRLGGPNLIKRVWDLAYLQQRGLVRSKVQYDSVPAVAAAPWLARLTERLEETSVAGAFWKFVDAAHDASEIDPPEVVFPGEGVPIETPDSPPAVPPRGNDPAAWLQRVDAQIFHSSAWEQWRDAAGRDERDRARLDAARAALAALCAVARVGVPGRYFAALALDGDEMGAWISGLKHPPHSPLTQRWHEDFSRALADFSLDHVRVIIEKHHGFLVYSGGDDVLAILPAETAVACADALVMKFRSVIGAMASGVSASVGIAIGHMKAPLQDMVAAAQDAEKLAKHSPSKRPTGRNGFGRDAFAVTLFKRSGELVEWGAKFNSKALPLLEVFQRHFRAPPNDPDATAAISGRFPHLLVERLSRFGLDTLLAPSPGPPTPPTPVDTAKAEFDWIVQQQTGLGATVADKQALAQLRTDLVQAGHAYLDELAQAGAPLERFAGLFSVEAFLNQQRD